MPDRKQAPQCPDCATRWWSTQKCTHVSIPLPPLPTSSQVLFNYASYPNIVDCIATQAPYSVQLSFRLVSRSVKRVVDSALSYRLELGLCWRHSSGDLPSWLAAPDGRGLPLLAAPPPGMKRSDRIAETLSRTRVVDVVDTGIFRDDASIHRCLLHEWIRTLLDPHTVRIRTPFYAPLPFRPRVLETYVDMAKVPSYEVSASVRRHVIRMKVDEGALFGDWTFDPTKGFRYEDARELRTVAVVLEAMPEQSWHCSFVKREAAWRDVLGALFKMPFDTAKDIVLVGFPEEEHGAVTQAVGKALEFYVDPIVENGDTGAGGGKERERKGVLKVSFRGEWHDNLLLEAA